MKTFKTVVYFSILTLLLFCLALQAAAQTVTPTPVPVADFSGNVTTGAVPLLVQFTDESTGSPSEWLWIWGDQTPNGTIQNPIHVFNTPGLYTVTLTATNPEGNNTTQKINYINVTAAPTLTPTPTVTPTSTPSPTPKPSATPRITPTPKPTKKPTPSPTPVVMPTIPPDLLPLINQSFATPTPMPTANPTPVPTLVPLPLQDPSPTPPPRGRDHVPGILAFAGFNVLLVALYAGISYLFFRR